MRVQALLLLTLLIFVLYLASCGHKCPDIYQEQVTKVEHHFDETFKVFDNIVFYIEKSPLAVAKRCKGASDVACSFPHLSAIVIREDLAENCVVLTHELLHFVLEKKKEKGNRDHSHPTWKQYPELFCQGERYEI